MKTLLVIFKGYLGETICPVSWLKTAGSCLSILPIKALSHSSRLAYPDLENTVILAVCKFARNFSSDCIEVEHRCILVVEVDAWLIYDGDGDVSDQEGREKLGSDRVSENFRIARKTNFD